MKHIKILMVTCGLLASELAVRAQDTTFNVAPVARDSNAVQVAFRKVNKKDLLGGVSIVDVSSQMQQN
jgi:hypothetical protein